jgi:hypothetical protein
MVVMMIGVTEVMSSIVVKMTTPILSILTTPVVAKPCSIKPVIITYVTLKNNTTVKIVTYLHGAVQLIHMHTSRNAPYSVSVTLVTRNVVIDGTNVVAFHACIKSKIGAVK